MQEINLLGGMVSRHWWILVVRGLFALLFAFASFMWPHLTLAALVFLFGAYAIVDGVVAVGHGLSEIGKNKQWWLKLLAGVVGIVIGVITFTWPGLTGLALLYLIGWYAILKGIFEITTVILLRRVVERKGFHILAGIAAIVFGTIMLFDPVTGALAVIWLIAMYATVYGLLLIFAGFQLHGFTRSNLTHHPA